MLTTTMTALMLVGCGTTDSESFGYDQIALGEKLYHETYLSNNRTMSCATCHVINAAMIDPKETSKTLGASLGDAGIFIGDRNAPTAAYASFSPRFHFDSDEELFIGVQFLDGRSADLTAQAKGEVEVNKNTAELGNLGLTAEEEADLVAFLKNTFR